MKPLTKQETTYPEEHKLQTIARILELSGVLKQKTQRQKRKAIPSFHRELLNLKGNGGCSIIPIGEGA